MKAEKLLMCFINLLLAAAFAFSLLVLMEQLPAAGWEWYSRSVYALPLLLCFMAGLAGRRIKVLRIALLPVSCLAAGVLMYLVFPSRGALDCTYIVLSLILGAVLYFIGLRGDEPFPPKLSVITILIYIFDCAYFYIGTDAGTKVLPVTWCALAAFLLSLYSFNTSSLLNALHNAKGGSSMPVPAGLRSRNVIMLTIFLLIAVPIANIGALHRGLNSVFVFIIGGIWKVIASLAGGGDSTSVQPAQASATPTPTDESINVSMDDTSNGYAAIIYFIILGIIALIIVLAVFIPRREHMAGGGQHKMKNFLSRLFRTRRIQEYEDSVERLMDLKGFIRQRREDIGNFITKLTERPERFEDMPDDRMRVRFAYKSLLTSRRVNRRAVYYTPRELAGQLGMAEIDALAEAYNRARYDGLDAVTPSDTETARRAIEAMKGGNKNTRQDG